MADPYQQVPQQSWNYQQQTWDGQHTQQQQQQTFQQDQFLQAPEQATGQYQPIEQQQFYQQVPVEHSQQPPVYYQHQAPPVEEYTDQAVGYRQTAPATYEQPHHTFAEAQPQPEVVCSPQQQVTESPVGASPTTGDPELVLVFNYRTLIDADTFDGHNFEAWGEVLDAFGYQNLSFEKFLAELALKSPSEVMMSLCPYTTKAEWPPILNKRDVRLDRVSKDLCFSEVMPIPGVKDFIIDCVRSVRTRVILISPFKDSVALKIAENATLLPFIDVVHCYTDREVAILEAMETMDVRPYFIPENLHHKWENTPAPANYRPPLVLCFECDLKGVRYAKQFGARVIGISSNGIMDAAETKNVTAAEEALLNAGAAVIARDFNSLKFEYLQYLPQK